MSDRQATIEKLVGIIKDYRNGQIKNLDHEHVERWISQFTIEHQLEILKEMTNILEKTYFSKEKISSNLSSLINNPELTKENPTAFWNSASLLDIQGGGNSQHELVQLFSELLRGVLGVEAKINTPHSSDYFYLDDAIYTGNRLRHDLESWIETSAPTRCTIHIAAIALHRGGYYFVRDKLNEKIRECGKQIAINWLRVFEVEDRKTYTYTSDVLRPTSAPATPEVTAYIQNMKYAPIMRVPGGNGDLKIFSSEQARNLIEQEFLAKGALIRERCPNLGVRQRPLGNSVLETLGFGATFVSYRNCPNNAPLVLWVGDPWYPLFPRFTNADAAIQRLFEAL